MYPKNLKDMDAFCASCLEGRELVNSRSSVRIRPPAPRFRWSEVLSSERNSTGDHLGSASFKMPTAPGRSRPRPTSSGYGRAVETGVGVVVP
jgi:hypothetical protein